MLISRELSLGTTLSQLWVVRHLHESDLEPICRLAYNQECLNGKRDVLDINSSGRGQLRCNAIDGHCTTSFMAALAIYDLETCSLSWRNLAFRPWLPWHRRLDEDAANVWITTWSWWLETIGVLSALNATWILRQADKYQLGSNGTFWSRMGWSFHHLQLRFRLKFLLSSHHQSKYILR